MAKFQPIRLAYKSYEPNSGEDRSLSPIIYLHGSTCSKEHWGDIPQIVANATKRKAYAIDARNHGDSEWSNNWSFDTNTDDLIHFMNTQGIPKAIFVGHSMGGVTAIKVALKRPDLTEKIIVEDMFVRQLPKELMKMVHMYITLSRKAIESAPAELDEDEIKKFIVQYVASNFPPEMIKLMPAQKSDSDLKHVSPLRRDANGRYKYKANMEVLEKSLVNPENIMEDNRGRFDGPALFIYGKLSQFLVGADEHHIKQFFPNADLVGIDDASHSVHIDKPLEFTDALLHFLS